MQFECTPFNYLSAFASYVMQHRKASSTHAQLFSSWRSFAARQAERYVPVPRNSHRKQQPTSQAHRVRIYSVLGLAGVLQTNSGRPASPSVHALRSQQQQQQPGALEALSGGGFEFQLGVSLYDESLGAFYGNTCYSMVQPAAARGVESASLAASTGAPGAGVQAAVGKVAGEVQVDFMFDVYFHSRTVDPHCMAVVS